MTPRLPRTLVLIDKAGHTSQFSVGIHDASATAWLACRQILISLGYVPRYDPPVWAPLDLDAASTVLLGQWTWQVDRSYMGAVWTRCHDRQSLALHTYSVESGEQGETFTVPDGAVVALHLVGISAVLRDQGVGGPAVLTADALARTTFHGHA